MVSANLHDSNCMKWITKIMFSNIQIIETNKNKWREDYSLVGCSTSSLSGSSESIAAEPDFVDVEEIVSSNISDWIFIDWGWKTECFEPLFAPSGKCRQ